MTLNANKMKEQPLKKMKKISEKHRMSLNNNCYIERLKEENGCLERMVLLIVKS